MTAIDDLPPLRETIRRHGLWAKKSLGQNFLLDLNLTARIARAGGPLHGVTVVEVGPGPGGLTRGLIAQGARRVIAIERDSRAIAALGEIAAHYPGRLIVIEGDALEIDWERVPAPSPLVGEGRGGGSADLDTEVPQSTPVPAALTGLSLRHQGAASSSSPARGEGLGVGTEWRGASAPTLPDPPPQPSPTRGEGVAEARIVANLPYNVATALLVRWLGIEPWPPWYDSLVLMFQREVAERIVAAPRTKQYGRLAVLAQWRVEARIMFDVAPLAFVPPPKVTSSVVQLVPRAAPLPCTRTTLERVTAAAFGQRRKTLRQSLRTLGHEPQPILAAAGIDPMARAEEVTVEGFVALANALDTNHTGRQ